MKRRAFVKASGAAAVAAALGSCLPRRPGGAAPAARMVQLVPPEISWSRVIRTTVGLRPFRESGFVLKADRLDEKTLIHNYGHGGSGWSLSWGTGYMAAELAVPHQERRAAVIGCGTVGLTTARQLQRRGFEVTIYAAALPPETTSNMSWAGFTPNSGLVSAARRTPEWDAQFRRAVEIAYREHQLLVGRYQGVSWIDEYAPTDNPGGGGRGGGAGRAAGAGPGTPAAPPLLPTSVQLGSVLLGPGEHPFATTYARRQPTLRFEPSIYLEEIMRDVLAFGGKIVVRKFDTPRDLMTLSEPVIVNCTGIGSRDLFGDQELTPVKGQLVVLVPQPEVNYTCNGMMPRSDGIVLGHVMQRGVWSLEVDDVERQRVMQEQIENFAGMRAAQVGRVVTPPGSPPVAPMAPPPVESFFDRQS